MRAVLVDPLVDVIPPQWDEFVATQGCSTLWRSRLLAVAAWCGQSPTLMAVVLDGERPVALLHGRFLGPQDPRRFQRPGALPPVGLFECRLHPASTTGYRFAADLDEAGKAEVVRVFERAARARFGLRLGGFCYRHVEPDTVAALRRRTRVTLDVAPDLVINNEWADIDAYLKSLPPKWRSQLRKIHATVLADPTVRGGLVDSVPVDQATQLLTTVRHRHQRRGWIKPPMPSAYVELLNADPDTRFLAYFSGDDLLAMSTVHDDGSELLMTYWGNRDRTEGGRQNLYFDHYLRLVEEMITLGRGSLRPGKGMVQIKTRFGATPEPRFLVAGW